MISASAVKISLLLACSASSGLPDSIASAMAAWEATAPYPSCSGCVQPVWNPPTAPASTTISVPGCPPVVIKPAQRALIDFTDFVVHNGVTYRSRPDRPLALTPEKLGSELFRVSCTFSKLNEITQSELPAATEHSAGFIPAQAPVFALKGWPTTCRLAAQHDGSWYVYVATIETAESSRYNECGMEPSRPTSDARS